MLCSVHVSPTWSFFIIFGVIVKFAYFRVPSSYLNTVKALLFFVSRINLIWLIYFWGLCLLGSFCNLFWSNYKYTFVVSVMNVASTTFLRISSPLKVADFTPWFIKRNTDQRTQEEPSSISFHSVFLFLQRHYWFLCKRFFPFNDLLCTSGFSTFCKWLLRIFPRKLWAGLLK